MCNQVILLVEDEVMIRMLMAEVLRDHGYEVIEAATGDEAMDIVLCGRELDLIVTDVRMPGTIDGVELTMRVKRLRARLPVVVVSGHLPPADANGADHFIAKPFVSATLLRAVEKLIGPPCQNPPQNRTAL